MQDFDTKLLTTGDDIPNEKSRACYLIQAESPILLGKMQQNHEIPGGLSNIIE